MSDWNRKNSWVKGGLCSFGIHSLFFLILIFELQRPKAAVVFNGNILKLSLSGIKIKKSNPDADEGAEPQVEKGKKAVTSNKNSKGQDKMDAMSCLNLKVKKELKALGISLPRRYFVQVYTKNAAVEGAWYVDKWISEKPSSHSLDKKLFEAFSECIRNSNFSEWGRKAVNYANAQRSISFAVEFND
ncbi:MAG: hypothetical protein WCI18_07795 [Pseudomonadota bacterium]